MGSQVDLPERAERLIRVSGKSPPQPVAQAIYRAIFDEAKLPVIRAIGAGAVCQACKSIAVARGLCATRGVDLGTTIGFDTVVADDGGDISAQVFHLYLR